MGYVWEYHQSGDLRWKVGGDITRAGVCFALSVQFIICTGTGRNFKTWLQPPEVPRPSGGVGEYSEGSKNFFKALADRLMAQHEIANTIIPRMAEQFRRVTVAGEGGAKAKYDFAVELVEEQTRLKAKKDSDGLNFDILPYNRRGPMTAGWAEKLGKDNGLKYISFGGTFSGTSGYHGIAAIVTPNQWGLFDPNYGIFFAVNPAGFATDIDNLFLSEYERRFRLVLSEPAQFTTFS
jgi:hypothetical protein